MKKTYVHKLHGDGIHDDTAALQERLDDFINGAPFCAVYKTSSAIIIPKGAVFIGNTTPPDRI